MATVGEKIKDGKIVSCKFKTCVGRSEQGKQIFRCMTWYPPANTTPTKIRRLARVAADAWEQEAKQAYLLECKNAKQTVADAIRYTFDGFVNDVWIPLCVRDGSHRPSTVAFYSNMLKVILPYFEGSPLDEITSVKISEYLLWLRLEYKTNCGKPLAEKSIKHHYNVLCIIFNYATRYDFIDKNPMEKVDTPKITKKSVTALSEDEAVAFLAALENSPLDFRCMLHLLITTGLRRGECLGLQWQDVDFEKEIINVNRAVTYTPESGIVVAAPKTANSVRTIPLMASTVRLLKEWRQEIEKLVSNIGCAYVFGSPESVFNPRDPNTLTRRVKRFIKANNLPNVSPHDLRHTCASFLLNSGADIKSVQEILGHADASTTLNFYVKSDIRQKRIATDKFAAAFNL